jgi:hypothetical protein
MDGSGKQDGRGGQVLGAASAATTKSRSLAISREISWTQRRRPANDTSRSALSAYAGVLQGHV